MCLEKRSSVAGANTNLRRGFTCCGKTH